MSERYVINYDGVNFDVYLRGKSVWLPLPGSHPIALMDQLLNDIRERDKQIDELTQRNVFLANEVEKLERIATRAETGLAELKQQIGYEQAGWRWRSRANEAEAELARLKMFTAHVVCDEPDIDAGRAIIVQSERIADLEAELARLRAQGPVAWMWDDMIGIPHTHISPTRPTWPDAGASSAMSVAINVRPLYAEPMPARIESGLLSDSSGPIAGDVA
jgi:hypothetical protein